MRKSTIIGVAALTCAVIAVPTVASAANGGAWVLGRSNSETAVTTVTNSAGTPLTLNARSGYAPLSVNSSTKVAHLNADFLDGVDGANFLRTTGKAADSDKVDGYHAYQFAMRSAKAGFLETDGSSGYGPVCPTGTIAMGGGGFDPYGYPLGYSGPDFDVNTGALIPNSWIALDANGYVITSYVNCVSLSGAAVPGAMTQSDYISQTSGINYGTLGGSATVSPNSTTEGGTTTKPATRPTHKHATVAQ